MPAPLAVDPPEGWPHPRPDERDSKARWEHWRLSQDFGGIRIKYGRYEDLEFVWHDQRVLNERGVVVFACRSCGKPVEPQSGYSPHYCYHSYDEREAEEFRSCESKFLDLMPPKSWKWFREQVLERDGHKCTRCGEPKPKAKDQKVIAKAEEISRVSRALERRRRRAWRHYYALKDKHKKPDKARPFFRVGAFYKRAKAAWEEKNQLTGKEWEQLRRTRWIPLEVDHIKPVATHPELEFEMSNCRSLCVPCHKKVGARPKRRTSEVLKVNQQLVLA